MIMTYEQLVKETGFELGAKLFNLEKTGAQWRENMLDTFKKLNEPYEHYVAWIDNLIKREDPILSYSAANSLVRLGYDKMRQNPSIMWAYLRGDMENEGIFKEWWDSENKVLFIDKISPEYEGVMLYDLTKGEAWIEATYFLIRGANIATLRYQLQEKISKPGRQPE